MGAIVRLRRNVGEVPRVELRDDFHGSGKPHPHFQPEACVPLMSKAPAQRFEKLLVLVSQYLKAIYYSRRERNTWGDILWRWVEISAVLMQVLAVHAPTHPYDSPSSKKILRVAQQLALIQEGIRVSNTNSFQVPAGTAVLDSASLFRATIGGSRVLWIPEQARDLKSRLIICPHMREAGQRRIAATRIRSSVTVDAKVS